MSGRRRKGIRKIIAVFFLPAAIFLAGLIYFGIFDRNPGQHRTKNDVAHVQARSLISKKKVAVIIDDVGYNKSIVDEFSSLKAPIAFAILPHCPYSVEIAQKLHQSGKEILIHIPMEPRGKDVNPGRGALLSNMAEPELIRKTDEAINSVPYASGANNHMGSKFMESSGKLTIVFGRLREKGMFFIDSRTTSGSKAPEAARRSGIKYVSRTMFLDTGRNRAMDQDEFIKVVDRSEYPVVAIGHPFQGTLSLLKKAICHDNIEFVTLQSLMADQEKINVN